MDKIAAKSMALVVAFTLVSGLVACEGRKQQSTQVGGVTPQNPATNKPATTTPTTPSGSNQGEQKNPGSSSTDDDIDDSGLTQSQREQGAQYVGSWDGLQDETKRPSDTTAKWGMVNTSPTGTPSTGGTGGTTTAVTYETDIRPILEASCTSCHRIGGVRASSPLTTYAEAKAVGTTAVSRVVAGTMPTGGLAQAQREKFQAWQTGGFLERAATGGTTPGGSTIPPGTSSPDKVEFRIKAGTGSNPWNTRDTEVVAKVGKPFTIYNDDSVPHQWHTNGSPCQHGAPIQPGQSETCTPSQPYNQGPLYDHLNEATGIFYFRAE